MAVREGDLPLREGFFPRMYNLLNLELKGDLDDPF